MIHNYLYVNVKTRVALIWNFNILFQTFYKLLNVLLLVLYVKILNTYTYKITSLLMLSSKMFKRPMEW